MENWIWRESYPIVMPERVMVEKNLILRKSYPIVMFQNQEKKYKAWKNAIFDYW